MLLLFQTVPSQRHFVREVVRCFFKFMPKTELQWTKNLLDAFVQSPRNTTTAPSPTFSCVSKKLSNQSKKKKCHIFQLPENQVVSENWTMSREKIISLFDSSMVSLECLVFVCNIIQKLTWHFVDKTQLPSFGCKLQLKHSSNHVQCCFEFWSSWRSTHLKVEVEQPLHVFFNRWTPSSITTNRFVTDRWRTKQRKKRKPQDCSQCFLLRRCPLWHVINLWHKTIGWSHPADISKGYPQNSPDQILHRLVFMERWVWIWRVKQMDLLSIWEVCWSSPERTDPQHPPWSAQTERMEFLWMWSQCDREIETSYPMEICASSLSQWREQLPTASECSEDTQSFPLENSLNK